MKASYRYTKMLQSLRLDTPQLFLRSSRAYRANKHLKALRRYAWFIRNRQLGASYGASFGFFDILPESGHIQWAPGRRHMIPVLMARIVPANRLMAAAGAISGTGTVGTGSGFYYSYTPSLYVAPSAQGSGDGSSEANAMALADAYDTSVAMAGDILGAVNGVYIGSPITTRWIPIFAPENSGTALSPIVTVAKYPAAYNRGSSSLYTEFRSNDPHSGPLAVDFQGNSAVWGASPGIDHVYFIGGYADMTYAPPRPSNGTFLTAYGCDGVVWEAVYVHQLTDLPDGDNFNSIYCEGDDNTRVANSYFDNATGSGNHNVSVITCYGSLNITVEHCEASEVNGFLFFKGTYTGRENSGTARFNRVSDSSMSAFEMATVPAASSAEVYQNLSIRNGRGVTFDNSVASACVNIHFDNNTVVDSTVAGVVQDNTAVGTGCSVNSNIIAYTATVSIDALNYANAPTPMTITDNLYYRNGSNSRFAANGVQYTSLSAWQTATSKDSGSAEGNPNFTDAAADNYHRSSYADGRGCYITGSEEIGLEAL